uniref:Uncharacterized protein n=1 Tax=Globodera rostochiensis TaxID=31243 RepID=A0A914IGE3_GLORO
MENAESVKVKLEELPLKTFDEIFGEGWWDKGEAADLKTPAPTNFGQNVHHQIDRQNTQLRLIEPNSTDQNPALTESDHLGQIEPNSTDQLGQIEPQNRPLTESDHFGQIEPNSTDQLGQIEPNSTDQNTPLTESEHSRQDENSAENERKRKIIDKFHAIKEEFRQKRKHLVEKFDQMKAELMRAGFKNSYHHEIDKTVAKELDLSLATIYNWKHELGQIMLISPQASPPRSPHSLTAGVASLLAIFAISSSHQLTI